MLATRHGVNGGIESIKAALLVARHMPAGDRKDGWSRGQVRAPCRLMSASAQLPDAFRAIGHCLCFCSYITVTVTSSDLSGWRPVADKLVVAALRGNVHEEEQSIVADGPVMIRFRQISQDAYDHLLHATPEATTAALLRGVCPTLWVANRGPGYKAISVQRESICRL